MPTPGPISCNILGLVVLQGKKQNPKQPQSYLLRVPLQCAIEKSIFPPKNCGQTRIIKHMSRTVSQLSQLSSEAQSLVSITHLFSYDNYAVINMNFGCY